jgi:predicted RND superfamily exporter protein
VSRRLAEFIYRWRFALSAVILVGALAWIPHVDITHIDNDITAWFSRDDPVFKDYERFRSEFGGTRTLIVALKADAPERLFSRETLAFIERVTGDLERVPTVQRVDSLATATILEAPQPDTLDLTPLLDVAGGNDPMEVRRRALQDDLIRGDLVSDDGTVTAVVVSFDEDRIDEVRAGVIRQIHQIVDAALPPGVHAYYNGSLEISEAYNRVTLDNQRKFMPPILLITIAAIYFTFGSWRKTMLAMFAVGVSILWTLGLYWLMGFTYNILSSMLVPLIVVLAIADDVHMIQHWDEERRRGDAEAAFKATISHLAAPLLGASATTALGMVSLATSNVVAVRAFGIGSAVGIMTDFVISLVLVPTLLSLVKPEIGEARHERYLIGPLRATARMSSRHPRRVLVIAVGIGLVACLGMLRLHVDTNHINFFREGHPLKQSAQVIDRDLSGVYSFHIMLEGPPESMTTPDTLQRIDRLEDEIRRFPQVKKVTSVVDYVKRINKELHEGKEDAAVVPSDAATIGQELFVFALGGEGRHELDRVIASDYSRAHVTVKLQSMSSDVVLQLVQDADAAARRAFAGTAITPLTTGSGRLFVTLDHYLVTSQLSSFGTAFVTVFGVIFIVFRSARFGVLTIVPNLLPVLAVLGVMGYLNISMNVATIMVASVALGVVDDDTIHFINRYRRETAAGASTDEAIETASVHEGRASLTTAVINCCGYAVLLFSEYRPTAWFGGLLALTMATAFLAEVFILPATIKLLPRIFSAEALRRRATRAAAAIVCVLASSAIARAQTRPTGDVSALVDYAPNRSDTLELRARVFAEEKLQPSPQIRITASGFVEGLVGRREALARAGVTTRRTNDAVVRVQDLNVDARLGRVDLLAGFSRVVWGRLDELQPTDVVNPLDVSRFFFEGRSEARLPVALARARVFLADNASVEAVYVPAFRRGRFDQLDEPSSPFNIAGAIGSQLAVCLAIGCPTLPPVVEEHKPAFTMRNAQGGARFSATSGRVDWSVSAYRGFEPFGLYRIVPQPFVPGVSRPLRIAQSFPRFTMVGSDFETVSGEWGLRGEVAAFVEDSFQSPSLQIISGRSLDAGAGVDRKAGNYRVSGTLLVHRESYDTPVDGDGGRTDVSLIAAADRAFARERYRARAFAVYNTSESSGFLRGITTATLRDNVAVEASVGWFIGHGRDIIGRFGDSDFAYMRLKYYF